MIVIERELNVQVRERATKTNAPGVSTFRPDSKQPTITNEEAPTATTSRVPPEPPARTIPISLAVNSGPNMFNDVPTIDLNKHVQKPEKFAGDRDKARAWIEDYEAAIRANRWSQQIAVNYFSTFLAKQARNWYLTMVQPSFKATTSWDDIRSLFARFYFGPDEAEAARDKLRTARQGKNEACTEFIPRILHLMHLAKVDLTEAEKTRELKIKSRPEYQDLIIGQRPQSVTQLNDLCLEIETRLAQRAEARERSVSMRPNRYGYRNKFKSKGNDDHNR